MEILLRIVMLVIAAILGWLLFAISMNLFIAGGLIPTETLSPEFGQEITGKAVIVWLIATAIGLIGVFLKQTWHKFLIALPLIAPSLFALFYALSAG